MAWTTPRTWVTAEVVTASQMNTHVRDQFLETAPDAATTAGGFIIGTGTAKEITERATQGGVVDTSQSTSSTSYTDLATTGPAATSTTGTRVIISFGARMWNDTAGIEARMGFAVTGASTVSASDAFAALHESESANQSNTHFVTYRFVTLTAGSNTFTAKYKATANTAHFQFRKLLVMPA